MLKNKCIFSQKCPSKMVDRGTIAYLYAKDGAEKNPKIPLLENPKHSYAGDYVFAQGRLCCDEHGSYDLMPKDAIFFTEIGCPNHSKNLGDVLVRYDTIPQERDSKGTDITNTKLVSSYREKDYAWTRLNSCQALEDLPVGSRTLLFGNECTGGWTPMGKSGFIMNFFDLENSPYDSQEPFAACWGWVYPNICKAFDQKELNVIKHYIPKTGVNIPVAKPPPIPKPVVSTTIPTRGFSGNSFAPISELGIQPTLPRASSGLQTYPHTTRSVTNLPVLTHIEKFMTYQNIDAKAQSPLRFLPQPGLKLSQVPQPGNPPNIDSDEMIMSFCAKPQNQDFNICACINSKLQDVGNPACIDQKCIDYGYKLSQTGKYGSTRDPSNGTTCDQTVPIICQDLQNVLKKYPDTQVVRNEYTNRCFATRPVLDNPDIEFVYRSDRYFTVENQWLFMYVGFAFLLFFVLCAILAKLINYVTGDNEENPKKSKKIIYQER